MRLRFNRNFYKSVDLYIILIIGGFWVKDLLNSNSLADRIMCWAAIIAGLVGICNILLRKNK